MLCSKCNTELPDSAICCWACGKRIVTKRKHRKRSNGTGSISKLSGNRTKPWLVRKKGISIGTFSTRGEAQKALERLTDTNVTDKFNMTFGQVYNTWLPEHEREISVSQKGCYQSAYKNCEELHDRQFRQLRKSDYQAVIIRLEEAGKSKSTCEKVLQLFGQLSKWALDEGIIQTNHAQNVSTVAQQKSTKRPFTNADIEAIQKSKLPAAQIALILIGTGCRPNELFSVPLASCTLEYFVGGSKTEAGKNRIIAVSPVGLEAYKNLLQRAKANNKEHLIDGYENGNRVYANFAKRDWKELMAEIGCQNMTPYSCRHTFITNAVRSGIKPELLKRMVGHADISTTDKVYTHLNTADILDAAKNCGL